jgi:hypothetical protein
MVNCDDFDGPLIEPVTRAERAFIKAMQMAHDEHAKQGRHQVLVKNQGVYSALPDTVAVRACLARNPKSEIVYYTREAECQSSTT